MILIDLKNKLLKYKMNSINTKLDAAIKAESESNYIEAIKVVNSLRTEEQLSEEDLKDITETEIELANKQNPITHYPD